MAKASFRATFRRCYGSEFISRDLDLWAYANNVTLDFSRPGKPTDNAFIEAFNSKFQQECLNAHWFMSLDDAREKLEAWRRYLYEADFVKPSYLYPSRYENLFRSESAVAWLFWHRWCLHLYPVGALPRTIIPIHGGQTSTWNHGTKLQLGE